MERLAGNKHSSFLGPSLVKKKIRVVKARPCGLYYKPMTIINDDARVVNKLEASFTDDARVVIYDRHMFIVEATGEE